MAKKMMGLYHLPAVRAVRSQLAKIVRNVLDSECPETEVRLQVRYDEEHKQTYWYVRYGDPSYDLDHRGHWGSSTLAKRDNCHDTAQDLLSQVEESIASGDDPYYDADKAAGRPKLRATKLNDYVLYIHGLNRDFPAIDVHRWLLIHQLAQQIFAYHVSRTLKKISEKCLERRCAKLEQVLRECAGASFESVDYGNPTPVLYLRNAANEVRKVQLYLP